MPQNAIIYQRVSSAGQLEGFGLERQKSYGVQYATDQGWVIEKVIADEGKSAFHAKNRVEGAALFEFEVEARNGLHKGKVLVVEHIDRLSREGAKAAARLIWALNEAGVDVATFQDKTIYRAGDNTDMIDIFKVIVIAQSAHEASLEKSNRGKANWKKRKEKIESGERSIRAGKPPAWIVRTTEGYELNERRAEVLNEIYDLYILGTGIHSISVMLNERREPVWKYTEEAQAKDQNGWFYSYLHRLLTHRSVTGEYVNSQGQTISPNFYPQAITAEKFAKAQAVMRLKKPNTPHNGTRKISLLTGLVVCSTCGGGAAFEDKGANSFTRHIGKDGLERLYARKHYRNLRCDRNRRKHQCDNDTILRYEVVEQTILDGLLPSLVERRESNTQLLALREQVAEAKRQQAVTETRIENATDQLLDAPSPALRARLDRLELELDAQRKEVEILQREVDHLSVMPSAKADVDEVNALRDQLSSDDPEITNPARRTANIALSRLLKRIEIEVGQFRVWINDTEWYSFDAEGAMLESEVGCGSACKKDPVMGVIGV